MIVLPVWKELLQWGPLLLERAYQGSAGKLVAAFLKDEKLTPQERDELRKLLDEMEV